MGQLLALLAAASRPVKWPEDEAGATPGVHPCSAVATTQAPGAVCGVSRVPAIDYGSCAPHVSRCRPSGRLRHTHLRETEFIPVASLCLSQGHLKANCHPVRGWFSEVVGTLEIEVSHHVTPHRLSCDSCHLQPFQAPHLPRCPPPACLSVIAHLRVRPPGQGPGPHHSSFAPVPAR